MTISAFKFGSRRCAFIKLPLTRAKSATWQPQIHDAFPDFTAPTTKGEISFSKWAAGRWVVLACHPAAFTPVCTSEIAALAKRMPEFDERNVGLIALTGDPLERVVDWTADIEEAHGVRIAFPHVADAQGTIAKGCGLLKAEPLLGGNFCARRTFLIDPNGVVRAIFDYPLTVGRSVDEILRVLDAMILSERMSALAPSDWNLGEPLILLNGESRPDLAETNTPGRKTHCALFRSDFNLTQDHTRSRKATGAPDPNAKRINPQRMRQP